MAPPCEPEFTREGNSGRQGGWHGDCAPREVKRRAIGEVIAVLATGGIYLVFENILHAKMAFLIPCALTWSVYIIYRLVKQPDVAKGWGLVTPTAGLRACGICFAAGLIVLTGYRMAKGFEPFPPGAVWIFLIYPFWAFIQEFVVQAMVVANLERLGWKRAVIIPVSAVLFGVAHAPDLELMGLCAVAGLAWAWLFLRTRNLYPLALMHAWLGALAYYWVLEKNPWLEMFPA